MWHNHIFVLPTCTLRCFQQFSCMLLICRWRNPASGRRSRSQSQCIPDQQRLKMYNAIPSDVQEARIRRFYESSSLSEHQQPIPSVDLFTPVFHGHPIHSMDIHRPRSTTPHPPPILLAPISPTQTRSRFHPHLRLGSRSSHPYPLQPSSPVIPRPIRLSGAPPRPQRGGGGRPAKRSARTRSSPQRPPSRSPARGTRSGTG